MSVKPDRRAAIPLLVTLLIAALWVFAAYQLYADRQQVLQSKGVELRQLATVVGEQMLRLFKLTEASAVATSRWIEQHPGVYPSQDSSFIDLVSNLKRLSDDALEIRVVDIDGGAHMVPAPTRRPEANFADREHFLVQQNAATRGFFIGDPLLGRISREWVVPMSYPVSGKEREISNVVVSIHLDRIIKHYEAQRPKPDGSITVLKSSGVTLFRAPSIEGAIGKSIAAAPDFAEHLSAKDEGLYRIMGAYDGVERLVAHSRLSGYPVIIAVTASLDDVLGPWWSQLRRLAVLMSLITVAAILFTLRFLRIERIGRELLARSEHRFRMLIEHAPDAILLFDVDAQRIIDANPQAEKLFGRSREDLLSGGIERLYAPIQANGSSVEDSVKQVIARALNGELVLIERKVRNTSGRDLIVEVRVVDMSEGGRRLLRSSFVDISDRKYAEARLELAASVFTHAREGIIITDAGGTIIEVNETFTRLTGYTREEALGENPRMLRSNRQSADFYRAMARTLAEKGHWYGEVWNRHKNGDEYAAMLTVSSVRDARGKPKNYVTLFSDITPIKEQQQVLEHIAHYDALTSLPNRVLLADRLQQAIIQSQRRGQPLAVVYLDLDGFKDINDRYGHEIGDELLIAVSRKMKLALREGDTLARLGGDEFVAVLTDLVQAKDCEPVLGRLLNAAAEPITLREMELHVSASIGVTLYPQDGVDADQLLRHADQAMYQAKEAGKNRYHLFDVAQDAAVKTRRDSVEHIRHAFYRREFVLYFQPKVNMKTGQVIGAEALIRWQRPGYGLQPPASFLPAIEDSPLTIELGEWVIDTALAQVSKWRAAGLDLPVSVNVGAHQLQQRDFVARLSGLLAAHPDVQPSCLELEILETSALEEMTLVSEHIRACRALGVSFALDDFGTGYSSLTYFKRLPVEVIKIDQSFVRDLMDDPEDLPIIDGIMGLAAAFHRTVIAEGVETVAHGELLLSLGCELAQGYGVARPMPAADMPGWVASWRPDPAWLAWRDQPVNHVVDLAVIYGSSRRQ